MYPQIFGKYVLEGELARGGMARLMLATLRGAGGFEKKLVVKQIRDELASDDAFVKRFVDEAKTTVALSHPNIVPVYELGVEQGTYFLAMELVEGVSIAELLDGGVLSPEQGAYVGAEVCRALDYAHRRMQVIHRDITPRNVMVDEEGQVKLIDFGIAALANAKNQVFGSPGHMAPEQMAGNPVGPPADLFALAALLMEAWSKKAPFRRKRQDDIEAALAAPRTKPSEIDPRLLPLDDVIARTLASDPKERPQDADELGRVLRKFLSGLDMGDIARELGARVRERRAEIRAKKDAPASSKKPDLERPPSR
ncbi:MAG TPA: serine/threonine-protein kinase, partial [Polyangiaceae bacterium]